MTSTTDTIPETPIGERVAADLQVLHQLVLAHPELAPDLARTLEALIVVLPRSSATAPADVADAAIALGAKATDPGWTEPHWPTRAVRLPGNAITLLAVKLAEPELVTTTEMADAIWNPSHSLGQVAAGLVTALPDDETAN